MRLLAQITIWASLLIITTMSGGVHYITCACRHAIYVNEDYSCCPKGSDCMQSYDIPVPDGVTMEDLSTDHIQTPLALPIYSNITIQHHETDIPQELPARERGRPPTVRRSFCLPLQI